MAKPPIQSPASNPLRRTLVKVLLMTLLCSLSYILGSYKNSNSISHTHFQVPYCLQLNLTVHKSPSPNLVFEPRHKIDLPLDSETSVDLRFFEFCPKNFTNYCPCQDSVRERKFNMEKMLHRERHCPGKDEMIQCLIPRPVGYKTPFPWPKNRNLAWFRNVPFKRLAVDKKKQNWVRLEGDRLVFPGGGTSFPMGVMGYVKELVKLVPLKSGTVRTALDVGCGVASFGASLMDFNILTMSMAPRDIHEAQVQFALERGLPAMLGVLSTYRLPYPSRSFDMAHCSRCLVPWTGEEGLYLMEIDRVLRPGGYWVLSGPPINWKVNYKGWQRQPKDLEQEQANLEDLARRLCWRKVAERGPIAVWRKPTNHVHCVQKSKTLKSPRFCDDTDADADAGWYKKMEACITPLPKVKKITDISGGDLEKWPKRLNAVPPRIGSGEIEGTTIQDFLQDNHIWNHRVSHYESLLKFLSAGKYRNVMDMKAGLGGFAAAMSKYSVWIMNVVPFDAKNSSLGVIYERGLIGTYMNWCEAFSTYPRTYDLIHANGVFSMYMDKCDIVDILFEMHRILRPEGAVIIRDHIDIIVKAKGIIDRMKWTSRIIHSEHGPFHPEKILLVDNSEQVDYSNDVASKQ
ncbi:probable methyltransferase PMT19 [Macadamia integrifolia]|uniref:probable methyltransferase PMT19 n=1 Tax=Macadamia integrifolia TaxID=60698 RepID=UPI001C4F7FD7|nr:probable methyltransferase PMT19 [Macadamia integrifolia]